VLEVEVGPAVGEFREYVEVFHCVSCEPWAISLR
jgi:hypothetical protein